ncbi:cupin domain-containing protein [Staphylococcus delphini]|uniref:Cupin domain-containing protein n=1 Tax=Staphylococcus delphini TaxID=53344 RepID=A0AAQ0IGL0_9STAP|nr:cupin domain-containing protein [Staphylococcus delphini]MDE9751629.1 cupin domain-containing protein [Staphylococcus delphini]MDE9788907.1 cupin domain-containing protein [Staphylococcus delphini]MDE9791459.1 cupin domain-containing protein [Staphylococcus delphini]MDE9793790.1 cupin domain-containing protein [Staphylococcus delphini]MDE9795860.1 cupin domain-containing protein [Staphylococcus delphini]
MSQANQRFFKMKELESFSDEAAKKTIFYQSEHSAGAIWCLKPGQTLPCHTHKNADDVWIAIKGEGTFYTNNHEKKTIKAGDIFVSLPGDAHGMTNTGDEDFVMLGFATPMPLDFIPYEKD